MSAPDHDDARDRPAAPAAEVTRVEESRREVSELLRLMALDVHRYAQSVSRSLHVPDTNVHAIGVLHADTEGVSASQLGEALGLSASATSALIDRLEASGHAVRAVSPEDGRRAHITVTHDAVQHSREHFADLNDAIRGALEGRSPAERQAFVEVLADVHAAVRDSTERRTRLPNA